MKSFSHALPLQRKGAWLISPSERWQMLYVQGPILLEGDSREYFRVETACKETILISRLRGERGMRELRLEHFLTSARPSQERMLTVA